MKMTIRRKKNQKYLERAIFVNKKTDQMSITFPKHWFGSARPKRIKIMVVEAYYGR